MPGIFLFLSLLPINLSPEARIFITDSALLDIAFGDKIQKGKLIPLRARGN
jgi:hypothetical protein